MAEYKHLPTDSIPASFRQDPIQLGLTGIRPPAGGNTSGPRPPWDPAVAGGPAGLVSSKTRSHETFQKPRPQRENDTFEITFSKKDQTEKRVKRLRRNVWASGHLHGIAKKGHRPLQAWFVTLTYALADAWKPNHVTKSIERFRRWCARKGYACKYTWVAEIQPQRAAKYGDNVVHYHLLAWIPVGVAMPQWDREYTTPAGRPQEPFWPHGMTNTEKAKSGVGYLMKYLSKMGELMTFPEGLRLYGMGGLDPLARAVRSWYNLPEWAKRLYGVGDLTRFNGRILCPSTGEILPPMYRREIYPGGITLHLLRDLPERFHDGAYSTFPRTQND